jgi:hypothetical protein
LNTNNTGNIHIPIPLDSANTLETWQGSLCTIHLHLPSRLPLPQSASRNVLPKRDSSAGSQVG